MLSNFPVPRRHRENHRTDRIGWVRAAVLGANDGIISIASLAVGVSTSRPEAAIAAAVAGWVAGAMSMAAGEYVSVSSQSDTEKETIARERDELARAPALEREELAAIYRERGLQPELAGQVAEQLMAHDALGAHVRDELGLSLTLAARPLQAALTSAATFGLGGALPLLALVVSPAGLEAWTVAASSLLSLAVLGAAAAGITGVKLRVAAARVALWGGIAMAISAAASSLF